MNRLDLMHTGARADLPMSVTSVDQVDRPNRSRSVGPLAGFYIAIAGFMGCGAAVIVTASLIALHIQ